MVWFLFISLGICCFSFFFVLYQLCCGAGLPFSDFLLGFFVKY